MTPRFGVSVAVCEAHGVLDGLTDQARRVVELASRAARALGHWDVGPEHLLLAWVDGAAETAATLRSSGLEYRRCERRSSGSAARADRFPLSIRCRSRIVQSACWSARWPSPEMAARPRLGPIICCSPS
ncbi:MAG: Clp protease N-terminal domain-containing protein [Solirubrobacteraceae bacterium]